MLPIAIGCDDAAFELKNAIVSYLHQQGIDTLDFSSDHHSENNMYPDVAVAVSHQILEGKAQRGILICGTGIGMCIMANKVPGIRAALCHDTYSAERARKSNDAQIITLGARVVGLELAKTILHSWLESEFEGGRSQPKVERINFYEQQELKHIA